MLLELNSVIFDVFNSFSDVPWIGILADAPIFFLPLFLTGMWLYYTFFQKNNLNIWEKILKKNPLSRSSLHDNRFDLLHIFYACILWLICSYFIKQFIDIERPESYIQQTGNLIMSSIPAKSFPSDHATVSFAFTIWLLLSGFKKVWYFFLPFVIIMNISRIVVWVHWPLDILVGSIVGSLAALICFTYIIPSKLVKKTDMLIITIMKKIRLY